MRLNLVKEEQGLRKHTKGWVRVSSSQRSELIVKAGGVKEGSKHPAD